MNSIYDQKPWLAQYQIAPHLAHPSLSVLDALEEHARTNPNLPSIRYFDETISFGQLNHWSECFAALLDKWHFNKGDRVALSLQNNPQFAVAQFAAWKRGVIVVPLNPMFREKELRYHLQDSGARAWVALTSSDSDESRAALQGSAVENVVFTSETEFGEMLTEAPDPGRRITLSNNDIAYLVYTSGTTGPAKGAMLTHGGVAFNAEVFRTWMQIGPGDSILGLAPLFHVTGIVAHLALSAWAAVPLILFHRFDVEQVFRLSRKWNATFSVAAITAYIALMNHAKNPAGQFLEKCYTGGAPVAPSITEQFEERLGTYIHNCYGLTESTSPSHATPLGARAPVHAISGALSIGVPVPNCDAKIVSLEDPDLEMPTGEAGELLLRGPMIFPGYWNKPEETANAFHNGYFRTGDVVIMDRDGWFYLVDRKKDMIVASGFKVWPREVEDTLYQYAGVREAAVIGVPDPYRGETVKAFVALKDGFDEDAASLIQFCRDRISAYKCPCEIVFVPEIPKTATGKFLRRSLRER